MSALLRRQNGSLAPDGNRVAPRSFEPDIWFAAYEGKNPVSPAPQKTSLYVLVPEATAWTATLPAGSDWLTIVPPTSGTGPSLLTLSVAASNIGPEKQGELLVATAAGPPLFRRRVRQASGVPLLTLNTSVLAVPFPATPRVMELGIAGKFIGTQLQKVPREILGIPVRLIVVIIVDLLLILLGILVILLRAFAFVLLRDPGLKEPPTWFPPPTQPAGFPATLTALTNEGVPVTTVYLLQEIYLLVVYIADVALSK